jgi:hypothetical protein
MRLKITNFDIFSATQMRGNIGPSKMHVRNTEPVTIQSSHALQASESPRVSHSFWVARRKTIRFTCVSECGIAIRNLACTTSHFALLKTPLTFGRTHESSLPRLIPRNSPFPWSCHPSPFCKVITNATVLELCTLGRLKSASDKCYDTSVSDVIRLCSEPELWPDDYFGVQRR